MGKEPTVANGYPLGRPEGREKTTLDYVIQWAIESLPMETRLYPDVYAWRVSDAVIHYQDNPSGIVPIYEGHPAHDYEK